MTLSKHHQQEAMLHPNELYNDPEEIVNDNTLSDHDKFDVLNNWSDSITQKLEATAENMTPTKSNSHDEELLRKITSCMEGLKKNP